MSEKIYPVPAQWASRAWLDDAKYQMQYNRGPVPVVGVTWKLDPDA